MTTPPPPAVAATALPPSSRVLGPARLRSYALWQLRDYLINKGIGTALVSGLLLFLFWTTIVAERGFLPPGAMDITFVEFMDKLFLFGVLFATNGIVSEDRKFGYYRFYFAKPVSAAAFYGQKFAVHVAGLLLVSAVMLGAHALVIAPHFPRAFFPVAVMVIIGLAGVGFLVSALFTLDWISLFAIYAAALIGWSIWGEDGGIRGTLVRALPPVHRLREIYAAVTRGEPVPMEPLWWIFIYGSACFILGLVVISRRRLATT